MADMAQALDRILGDPEAMAQIAALAGKLNGAEQEETPEPIEADPEAEAEGSRPNGPDLRQLVPLLSQLRQSGGGDPQSEALIRALRPYLSDSRRRKLDKAVRLAALARTAKTALDLWKEGKLSV